MKYRNEQYYILALAKAIVLQEKIPVNNKFDWRLFYQICKYHKIDNLIAYGIDELKSKVEIPQNILDKFNHARQQGIMRQTIQSYELNSIIAKFEEKGINNLPLKGAFLKKYYPHEDMRLLTDFDILYKKEEKEQMHQALLELGYQLKHSGDNHDVYIKLPLMVVEMHHSCYGNKCLEKYFETVFSKVLFKKDKKYSFEMSLEDFYIFMIGHMAKHFVHGGIGIRSLLDLVVFKANFFNLCNWNFINQQLAQAKLLKFNDLLCSLLDGNEEETLLNCFFDSGAYGNMVNNLNMTIIKDGIDNLFFKRVTFILSTSYHLAFPEMKIMKEKYCYLNKYRWLLPYAYFQRGISKFIKDRCEFTKIVKRPFIPRKDKLLVTSQLYAKTGLKREDFDG